MYRVLAYDIGLRSFSEAIVEMDDESHLDITHWQKSDILKEAHCNAKCRNVKTQKKCEYLILHLWKSLGECTKEPLNAIVIEQQPYYGTTGKKFKNETMRILSYVVFSFYETWYHMHPEVSRPCIVFQGGAAKLKVKAQNQESVQEPSVIKKTRKKDIEKGNWEANKKKAVVQTRLILQEEKKCTRWLEFFDSIPGAQHDISDAFLHAVFYLKNNYNKTKKPKVPRAKPKKAKSQCLSQSSSGTTITKKSQTKKNNPTILQFIKKLKVC